MNKYEDYKRALNEIKEDITLGIKLSEEDFKDTYNDLLELVEKEKPKKVLIETYKAKIASREYDITDSVCPVCRAYDVKGNYCSNCGQKLDWSE